MKEERGINHMLNEITLFNALMNFLIIIAKLFITETKVQKQ